MMLNLKVAFICHALNVIGMLFIGLVYVFSNEFMPYHSDVIQTYWNDLGKPEQILYLGMMRTEGAGFLATALSLTILLLIPFKKEESWSYWAIPAIGIIEYLPTLFATYNVAKTTPASPPWIIVLGGCVLFIIGLVACINSPNLEKK